MNYNELDIKTLWALFDAHNERLAREHEEGNKIIEAINSKVEQEYSTVQEWCEKHADEVER